MIFAALAHAAPMTTSAAVPSRITRSQDQVAPEQVVLTSEEAALTIEASKIDLAETESRIDKARKNGDDTAGFETRLRALHLLQRAISAGSYPSVPPKNDARALRKWLYVHVQALTSTAWYSGKTRREGRKTVSDAADSLVKRLGQQYEAAVEGVEDGTLKGWGYFDRKYNDNFKADPALLEEWFTDLVPMVNNPRSSSPAGPLQMLFDVAPGEVVSGERQIRVDVKSAAIATKIEMYVDGELRATSEAKPFHFNIDALDEQDGNLKLKFVAYDETGTRVEFPLTVKIDSGASKGATYHVEKAREALADRDYARAERSARTALRVEPENVDATIFAAASGFKRGHIDLAEKFALDVEQFQPNNIENLNLLAGINVYKVFETRSTGDNEATFQAISDALSAAAGYRRRVLDARADIEVAAAKNPIAKADAEIANYRYSLAEDFVRKQAEASDFRDNPSVARLVYGLMRQSRYAEAEKILNRNAFIGKPDQYLILLRCLIFELNDEHQKAVAQYQKAYTGSANWATETIDAALNSSASDPPSIRAFVNSMKALGRADSSHPVTSFYTLRWAWAQNDFDRQTATLRAGLTREPAAYDLLVEQGSQQLSSLFKRLAPNVRRRRVSQAESSFHAALQAKPDAAEALTGYALVLAANGDWDKALATADAARRAGVNYASGQYTYASILEAMPLGDLKSAASRNLAVTRRAEARKVLDATAKMDPRFAKLAPRIETALIFYQRFGRPPVIATPAEAYAVAE